MLLSGVVLTGRSPPVLALVGFIHYSYNQTTSFYRRKMCTRRKKGKVLALLGVKSETIKASFIRSFIALEHFNAFMVDFLHGKTTYFRADGPQHIDDYYGAKVEVVSFHLQRQKRP